MSNHPICQGCEQHPSIGVLTYPDGDKAHLCQHCVPNSPMFHFVLYPQKGRP